MITVKRFEAILKKNYLFENKPKIAVAVSGGPDSIALVFLLQKWISKQKGSMIALIVDHRIRDNSKLEAIKINEYLQSKKISTKILCPKKMSVQKKTMKEARNNRYQQFYNYCKKNKILHLFLGHHFDDNIETYLLRKLAGSNLEGLRSIQNKVFKNDLQILRPFLDLKKNEIIKFNFNNKLNYIIDPSNDNIKYTRVVVRKFLLKNIYSQLIQNDFNEIKYYYPFYIQMVYQVLHKMIVSSSIEKIVINIDLFQSIDKEISIKIMEIIYKFLKPKKRNVRYIKLLNILDIVNRGPSISLNLAGVKINKHNDSLIFTS